MLFRTGATNDSLVFKDWSTDAATLAVTQSSEEITLFGVQNARSLTRAGRRMFASDATSNIAASYTANAVDAACNSAVQTKIELFVGRPAQRALVDGREVAIELQPGGCNDWTDGACRRAPAENRAPLMKSLTMERRSFLELTGGALAARVMAQRARPKSEFDYVDWSWERWRTITKASQLRIVTEQAGKAELADLLTRSGEKVATPEQWKSQRAVLKGVFEAFLGESPKTKPPAEARIIEETQRGNHTVRRLAYQTEDGEFVPSLLLIPRNNRGRAPVVICPHQTTQAGKMEPSGLAGNPQLHTALHLVERGYVTFTYDALCFGERHDRSDWSLR